MNFLHPAAFAGAASILLLILLSLWRHRPIPVRVPSIRLWERVPDRIPSMRSMQKPRASLSLLFQMVAAAAIVTAMAGPGLAGTRPAPRRIALVIDLSASMTPRGAAVAAEVAKLDAADDFVVIASPTLTRGKSLAEVTSWRPIDRRGDPRPALDLAAAEAPIVIYLSDRMPAWNPPQGIAFVPVLVGGPLRNVGIVDAGVDGMRGFARLTEAARLEVSGKEGRRWFSATRFHLFELPGDEILLSLAPDEFPADDQVKLVRSPGGIDVGFEGRPDRDILAAIESNPRARVVRGGKPALLIRVGAGGPREGASCVVDVDPVEGVESWSDAGTISLAEHPLTQGLEAEDLRLVQVGKLAGEVGTPLVYSSGGPIFAERSPRHVVLAARWASTGWPARPSFPIFWANVVEYAASAGREWRAAGLLDEAASAPGVERRPLDPGVLGPRPAVPVRTDLTGAAAAVAVLALALLWRAESRAAA